MIAKDKWDNDDFNNMDWHDCRIYSITLPEKELSLILDIDYIFEWILNDDMDLFKFWISPCKLAFFDVSKLKIQLDYKNSVGMDINEILMMNPTRLPNAKKDIYDFEIVTEYGYISFSSTGFEQTVIEQPILSDSINIGRD